MTQRLNYTTIAPAGIKALGSVYSYIEGSGLPGPRDSYGAKVAALAGQYPVSPKADSRFNIGMIPKLRKSG